MSIRLLLLLNILIISTSIVYSFSGDGYRIKRESNGTLLELSVGKEVMMPEVEEETEEEQEKEANKQPSTDVIPAVAGEEVKDKQKHDGKKGKNIEIGMPPKYPLKAESAETSAHDNEIGGCRDHPRAGLVCNKCENGNKCFPAEHESYTYSYCRRSCRHCDPSTSSFHTFWRLRAMSEFEPTWMLQQVEFYADPQEKISLVDDPEKAYASSVYTGYKPSFAFDNNNSTAWYPSGWGIHDNNDDWIAYEFTVAVRVHGIRMVVDKDHATAAPKKVVVEASDKMYGPFMKKWTIYNTDYAVDKVYKLLECDVLWRRLEVDDGAWCFRLIAKLETWEGARRTCEIEGGDLATISNKEEQRFVADEVGLCSHTWFGLSHTNQGYYWNDGSNSTFRNWKEEMTYSDVQKQTLNCAAMDPEGIWYNFHCSNKFYFLCKKRLVPRPDPRPDLTDNAWPYPPEVPPLIFFSPNVTVPVINSKNLEPGIFPDANGKVEGEEEEDITLSDLFYEQTVEHLKEKGLKPSEEIEADENQEETDFTQELNKIAINTSPGDFQNETKGDQAKNGTAQAHHQEMTLEDVPNKEANNAETSNASADAPKPKPKHKEKPVPPPPEDSEQDEDSSYPEIVHGKAVQDSSSDGSGKSNKKLPKGQTPRKDSASSTYFPEAQPGVPSPDYNGNVQEQPHKAGTIKSITKKKKRKDKTMHNKGDTGPAPQDNKDSNTNTNNQQFQGNSSYPGSGMMFYVPNANGTYTLMRPIYPWGNYNAYPGASETPNKPPTPPPAKEGDGSDDDTKDSVGPSGGTKGGKNRKGESQTLTKDASSYSPEAQPGMPTPDSANGNVIEQPYKAGTINTKPKKKRKRKLNHLSEENAQAPQDINNKLQASVLKNISYEPGMFYVANRNGTYTLMRPIYPESSNNGYQADMGAAATLPQVESEGSNDDDDADHNSAEKNKEIPMHPFVGPLGPSLAQQNISKSSRRKIKVLQPLESAAQGEDYSIMSEVNKMKRKKVLSRTLIHPKHETIASTKKHHVKGKHTKKASIKVAERYDSEESEDEAPKVHKHGRKTKVSKVHETSHIYANSTSSPSLGVDNESADIEESGSGSGNLETDNADIINESDEDFWSRK